MDEQSKSASRVSPRKATPSKQTSKQQAKGGSGGGARKPAAAAGAGGRARGGRGAAAAAAAAESSDEDDDNMPEGVLFEVKSLCGKRIKHGELQYQVEWVGWPKKTWSDTDG